MPHFLMKLVPNRPTFPGDMTDAEREMMQRHAAYCESLVEKGIGLIFGPVFDPAGAWGLGIVEAADMDEAQGLGDNDPAVAAGIGRYHVAPMRVSFAREA